MADLSKRFWSEVDKTGRPASHENPRLRCWIWTAGTFSTGYGQFRVGERKVKAHRFAYEDKKGPIPAGALVRHKCDNPLCVRPGHLEIGYSEHNARDRQRRGRTANPSTKLTRGRVLQIRRSLVQGESQSQIATRFDVTKATVGKIARAETWREGPWP